MVVLEGCVRLTSVFYGPRNWLSLADHRNRGRRPAHALDPVLAERVVGLAKTTYAGCNDSHLAELLKECEGIRLSRATVQRVLRRAGVTSPWRHRAPRYRNRRAAGRVACFRQGSSVRAQVSRGTTICSSTVGSLFRRRANSDVKSRGGIAGIHALAVCQPIEARRPRFCPR